MTSQPETPTVGASSDSGRDAGQVAAFVERFGGLFTAAGMPRLAARIFALILIDEDGRMTVPEICAALTVSPAAVSAAMSYLHQVGMTRREREPGSRRDVHTLLADDWYTTMVTRTSILTTSRALLLEGSRAAGGPSTPAGRRLWLNAQLFAYLEETLSSAITGWEDHKQRLLAQLDGEDVAASNSAPPTPPRS